MLDPIVEPLVSQVPDFSLRADKSKRFNRRGGEGYARI